MIRPSISLFFLSLCLIVSVSSLSKHYSLIQNLTGSFQKIKSMDMTENNSILVLIGDDEKTYFYDRVKDKFQKNR